MFFFIPFLAPIFTGITTIGSTIAVTATTIAATSVVTVGGFSLTVGGLTAGILASATTIGISQKLIENSETYYSTNLTENQKKHEMKQLENQLSQEISKLNELNIEVSELKIIKTKINEHKTNHEYFNALKYINDIKLQYAGKTNKSEMKNEIEKLYQRINSVREETLTMIN